MGEYEERDEEGTGMKESAEGCSSPRTRQSETCTYGMNRRRPAHEAEEDDTIAVQYTRLQLYAVSKARCSVNSWVRGNTIRTHD